MDDLRIEPGAETEYTYDRKANVRWIRVGEEFLSGSPAMRTRIALHELGHGAQLKEVQGKSKDVASAWYRYTLRVGEPGRSWQYHANELATELEVISLLQKQGGPIWTDAEVQESIVRKLRVDMDAATRLYQQYQQNEAIHRKRMEDLQNQP